MILEVLQPFTEPEPAALPFVSVIIPALNEEEAITRVLGELPAAWVNEVIVVDNGSTDGTARAARGMGARVVSEPHRGYGAACLAGMQNLNKETDIIVFLDGDYSDFPGEIGSLIAPILAGHADLAIGTRTQGGAAKKSLTLQQRWGNWLATTLIYLRFGHHFTDLGPFRAVRRDALEKLEMADRNFGWTVEMQIKAVLAGCRTVEVPVHYRPRIGHSKISGTLKGVILAAIKILATIGKYSLPAWAWRRE